MKFESRKLYKHGQNKEVVLLQIPKLICQNMGLTSDTLVDLDYSDDKIIISKVESKEVING